MDSPSYIEAGGQSETQNFLDECFANTVHEIRKRRPSLVNIVKLMEYGDPDNGIDPALDVLELLRNTRTYHYYPISLGDENRFIMTMFSYKCRFTKALDGAENIQQFGDAFLDILEKDQL